VEGKGRKEGEGGWPATNLWPTGHAWPTLNHYFHPPLHIAPIMLTPLTKSVIPRSEIVGTKPPYVCPGCFIHKYSNNMISRFHVQ
jgi:hypothetical protein